MMPDARTLTGRQVEENEASRVLAQLWHAVELSSSDDVSGPVLGKHYGGISFVSHMKRTAKA